MRTIWRLGFCQVYKFNDPLPTHIVSCNSASVVCLSLSLSLSQCSCCKEGKLGKESFTTGNKEGLVINEYL
jgi:hypothetical protein